MAMFNSYVKICQTARGYHPIVPLNHYKISFNPIQNPISISYVLNKRPPFGPFPTGLAPPDGLEVKFRKPVVPGDTLVMEVEVKKFREKAGLWDDGTDGIRDGRKNEFRCHFESF